MTENTNSVVAAIGGVSKAGSTVHIAALMLAILMFVVFIYKLQPLYVYFIARDNWGAVLYLILACLIIPAYWPYAAYRLLLLLMHVFVSWQVRSKSFPMLEFNNYPPISIIVAIRNESASMVIPLIKSLIELDYPDYEIVIADNSDLILPRNIINKDIIEVIEFAENHGVRIVRRDCGACVDTLGVEFPHVLHASGSKGDTRGGKGGNLNAAIGSANKRYKWFFLLDSDSLLTESTLCQMISVGVQAEKSHRSVGFVQSILSSSNCHETALSHAQSQIDSIYYGNYFIAKAGVGVVSNWGHGVLVSRNAWNATNGFPLEISEDLAWAIDLHLLGEFDNYYALCHTLETKPATWKALKIQRNRWAKGTTILVKTQLRKLWRSENLLWHEKMDLTYDYAEKSPFAVFGFRPLGAPKNGSKKLIEN